MAEIALETARIQRQLGANQDAERTLREGIQAARTMEERLLLPRLLASLADLQSSRRRFSEAATLLDEAADILHGLFTSASSPWVQSRLVSGMDDVFVARIRLEGTRGANAERMYTAIEEARGRALLELLANRPLATQGRPKELLEGERRVSGSAAAFAPDNGSRRTAAPLGADFRGRGATRASLHRILRSRSPHGHAYGPSVKGIAVECCGLTKCSSNSRWRIPPRMPSSRRGTARGCNRFPLARPSAARWTR